MKRILVVISIIFVLVISMNIVLKKHIGKVCNEMYSRIDEIKQELMKEETDFEKVRSNSQKMEDYWMSQYDVLAYYIEHSELDKVNIQLAGLQGYVATEDNHESVANLDTCVFILQHIQDRETLKLRNIF